MDPRTITLEAVQSSNITALGYDEETKTAVAEFKNGARYKISPVEPNEFDDLKNASSIGKHYNGNFRNNPSYDIVRL